MIAEKSSITCIERNFKHGKGDLANYRLFRIWCAMKARCYTKGVTGYENYGGRGIVVCDEWRYDFEIFETWALENGYNDALSIDRKECDGNYESSNCRWATMEEQGNNKRNNRRFIIFGEDKTVAQWVRDLRCKTNAGALCYRIDEAGWNPEIALTTPPLKTRRCDGQPKSEAP